MKTLIGGAIAAVIGLICLTIWFRDFLDLLAGAIPILLLLGGSLAIYLGFDELKDSWKKEEEGPSEEEEPTGKYKQEIEELKKEIETLKTDKA